MAQTGRRLGDVLSLDWPVKRSGFARKVYAPPPKAPLKPLARPPSYARASTEAVPVPKAQPLRDEGYRRLVAALPCVVCGIVGISQAAHADAGKGAGIKTDDRTCYPACSTTPGRIGCHDIIGASGMLTRDERRKAEALYGALTRQRLRHSDATPSA